MEHEVIYAYENYSLSFMLTYSYRRDLLEYIILSTIHCVRVVMPRNCHIHLQWMYEFR